ncbi:histidine phosphatase superfamily [Apiospora rasikravindrae]|uniref:Histidine phosphatase superfamily n=1 Tax=Apiospora rasikravindrae TaxID=990691 RepID=A0ABR1TFN9_9PEZI
MPATIWLVRHGQALHNTTKDRNLFDPELTELGKQQAQDFYTEHADAMNGKVVAIYASPSIRTIETARLCFAGPVSNGKRICLEPDLMELSPDRPRPCNVPRDQRALLDIYRDQISLANLTTSEYMDRSEGTRYEEKESAWQTRTAAARDALFRIADALKDDEIIAVVSHYHTLGMLVADGGHAVKWTNCQMRPYRFERDPQVPGKYKFVESLHRTRSGSNHGGHVQAPGNNLLSPPPTPANSSPSAEKLRGILKRVHGEDYTGKPRNQVSWDTCLQIQREFRNMTREETRVREESRVLDLTPRFQIDVEFLNEHTRMRARQLARYCSIHPDHGWPEAMVEQALVLARNEPWSFADLQELLYPDEWHPTNPDMPEYQAAWMKGWRRIFPGQWDEVFGN